LLKNSSTEQPVKPQPAQQQAERDLLTITAMELRELLENRYKRLGEPYPCTVCHGDGYIRFDLPVGSACFGKPIPCPCSDAKHYEFRYQTFKAMSDWSDGYKSMTFESFEVKDEIQQTALDISKKFVSGKLVQHIVLFHGPMGAGKTHLMAAVTNELLSKQRHPLFVVTPVAFDRLRDTFNRDNSRAHRGVDDDTVRTFLDGMSALMKAEYLMLDDMGAENMTAWTQEKLYELINHRYMHKLPTMISTNIKPEKLTDSRLKSRLMDRLTTLQLEVACQDYRQGDEREAELVQAVMEKMETE
jgi:DNA replication protein DnaC